jgi:hypothetical protein
MIAAVYARTLTGRRILLALLCLLALATSTHSDSAWVLWARACNPRSQSVRWGVATTADVRGPNGGVEQPGPPASIRR